MGLAAGRLRHRITIQEHVYLGQNPDTGAEIREWQDFHSCWAAIEPLSAREFLAAQSMQSKVSARITIRYVDGLDASMRILHKVRGITNIFNIEGLLADKDSGIEYQTIPVSEGVKIRGE